MWPKAFAQLIELAPHISRLLPLADRVLKQKAAGVQDDAGTRRAIDDMAEGLRGDLGQVTAAHAGLYKQIHELSARVEGADSSMATQLDGLGTSIALLGSKVEGTVADSRAARLAAESLEARLRVLEAGHGRLQMLLILALVLIVAMLAFQSVLFIHTR